MNPNRTASTNESWSELQLLQGIAGSPVHLTVASPTVLLLNVSRVNSSARHLVEGWLKSGGVGVSRTVTVKVNGTGVYTNATDGSGHFSFARDFEPRSPQGQPVFERATYMIEADFNGEPPVTATACSKALDGTSYAACTTIQYGHKPCSNSTMLVIDPQSTGARTLLVLASHNL